MSRVFLVELRRSFSGRWFAIASIIGVALAGLAAGESILQFENTGFDITNLNYYPYYSSWSCYSTWLGVGSWGRSGLYYLFFYGIVFVAPFAYSWSSISETQSGYCLQMVSRCSYAQYCFSKLIASFLASTAVAAIALLSNLFFVACYFPAYMPDSYDNFYTGMTYSETFADIFYSNPLLFVLLRTMFDACLCGAWSSLILSIGWFVKSVPFSFIVPYLCLLALEFCNHFFFAAITSAPIFEFSVFQILQGWSFEYSHEPIASAIVLIILLCLSVLLTSLKTRGDAV